MRFRLVLLRLFLLSILITLLMSVSAQSLPRDVRLNILEAVVQIIPWDDANGQLAPWSGSGTIISPDGYILTNFHVIGDTDTRQYFDYHAILMTDVNFTDQPPQLSYWAQYVASDPTHDLAILKIVQYPDESPIPADLRFKSVPVGNSNDLLPGDSITIVGYPGISGSTVTFTGGLMSGWLGEDFEQGGKQWIKTDAKIAHGNSGGAAFDRLGHLIGVPTAGRTVQYEELDVEEQAYVRPIGLAWAIIGPNVPQVTRGPGQVAIPTTPTTPTTVTSPSTAGQPSGDYGVLSLDSPVSNTMAVAQGEAKLVYHSYALTVPAGLAQLSIAVNGQGNDADMAFKLGAPIQSYEEVDHLDTSTEPNPQYVIDNPAAGTIYIDVLNLLDVPLSYTLSVTSQTGQANANPLAPTPTAVNPLAPTPSSGALAPISVETTQAMTIGAIALNQSALGSLEGGAEGSSFHTFVLEVPSGVSSLTVRLKADLDLDLAMKYGTEIQSYADLDKGGDWTYRDNSVEPTASFQIDNPQAGTWYIDIFNTLGVGQLGTYILDVESP